MKAIVKSDCEIFFFLYSVDNSEFVSDSVVFPCLSFSRKFWCYVCIVFDRSAILCIVYDLICSCSSPS